MLPMAKRKIQNTPLMAFLIALTINALLFSISWEPVVQGKADSLLLYILYALLYVVGAASFFWSYQISKQAKSKKWQYISATGLMLTIAWICFLR
jgi:hypothetical protein